MKYYFPPKPTLISITQPLFDRLDKDQKFVAELKYNGSRLLLVFSEGKFEFWGREGQVLKYSPSKELEDQLKKLKLQGECLLDGELLHFKVKGIKDTIVLFDVLVWNGEFQGEKTFEQRRALLESIFGGKLYDRVFPAPQWRSGFKNIYEENIKRDEIEGLVMKKLDAKLICGKSSCPVVKYMFKVRKPGPTYRF